jgi:hypothetical protein
MVMMNDDQGAAVASQAPQDEADADARSEERPRRRWSFLTEMVVLFAVALTIALLIKSFVVQPFFIPSSSMENTLLIGDKVLVNKLVYHVRPIQRGDIIVFNGDDSWNPPTSAQAGLVSSISIHRLLDPPAATRGLISWYRGRTSSSLSLEHALELSSLYPHLLPPQSILTLSPLRVMP